MYLRILITVSLLSPFVLFLLAAGGTPSGGSDPVNISNWHLAIAVGVWGVFQGLTVAWFRQKLDSLQTKDGCASTRDKCQFDNIKPLFVGDSQRKNMLDVMANEVKHLVETTGRLESTMQTQNDEIAKLAKAMIKIGARFGVDLNGKD